jgi:ATP/ADP translocase/HEAT repeat protein
VANLYKLLHKGLGLKKGELGKTAGMFVYLLMAVGTFVTGRITRDTLFLSRYDITYLPYMYTWVAIAMIALAFAYSHFADRFRRDRLVLVVTSILLAGILAAHKIISLNTEWFLPVFYVYVDVMGGLLIIQFWTFANDVFNTREAKRLFGIVGAGGVLATILVGFSVHGTAKLAGTTNLLYICAGLLAGIIIIVGILSRTCRLELEQSMTGLSPAHSGTSLGSDLGKVLYSRHLKVIAWIVLLTFFVTTMVDYQFKIISRNSYLNQEDTLSGFFGLFYAVTGIISFFIQFFTTGKVLNRFGIIFALLLLPLSLTIGNLCLILFPALWSITLTKGADNMLRYTINDATTQLLYLPVPGRLRGRAKAVIDGIIKPSAQGICGLLIAWTTTIVYHRIHLLSIITVFATTIWIIFVLRLKKEYIKTLVGSLRRRRFDFADSRLAITDNQAIEVLESNLLDEDENNVLHALEILPSIRRHDWSESLGQLTEHESPQVRLQAIRQICHQKYMSHIDRILDHFYDPDEEVRAEAIISYCTLIKEKAMGVVEPFLIDEAVKVRASAAVGLILYGGLEGIVTAAECLKAMIDSKEADHRKMGAWAIGRIGVKTFYRSIIPLLDDPDTTVQIEAIRAAGQLKCSELTLPLIYRLADPRLKNAAIAALASFGATLTTTLRTILNNPKEDSAIRQVIPAILCKIANQPSLDVLFGILETVDLQLRANALNCILKLHHRHPHLRRDKTMLRRILRRELKDAYQLKIIIIETKSLENELLTENIYNRFRRTIGRILTILRVLFSKKNIESAYRNITAKRSSIRANAIELLDNILDRETRRCLLPLLEEKDDNTIISIGNELFGLQHQDEISWLHQLLSSNHEWTTVCALHSVSSLADRQFEPIVRVLLAHPSAVIRESAVFCLKKMLPRENLKQAVSKLEHDPSPRVRQVVFSWLQ